MTFRELLKYAEMQLRHAGIEEAKNDAWLLLEDSFTLDRTSYFLNMDSPAEGPNLDRMLARIKRRQKREPLQYILGCQEFMGIPFRVGPEVLIPRQDTEVLVERILRDIKEGRIPLQPMILDICTGSGCIAVSLAKLCSARVTACDLSAEAIRLARENSRAAGVSVDFAQGDLFEALGASYQGKFDVIVSNPPYISPQEYAVLMPEVHDYEPRMALEAEDEGLYFYRRIGREACAYLKDGGRMYLEIGASQGLAVSDILAQGPYREIEIEKDLAGHERMATCVFSAGSKENVGGKHV